MLLTKPERCDGNLVSVTGVISTKFEGEALWMNKEFYENCMFDYSVHWKSPKALEVSKKYEGTYVQIDGIFHADPAFPDRGFIEVAALQVRPKEHSKQWQREK
jgi:hypothetical protein